MLTVKHIRHGIENVYEAPHGVLFVDPEHTADFVSNPGGLTIIGTMSGVEPPQHLMDGFAYVMNDTGATVASYRLPSSDLAGSDGRVSEA